VLALTIDGDAMDLTPKDLLEGFAPEKKSYTTPQSIAGVETLALTRLIDDRGLFLEIFRSATTHPGTEKLVQFFKDVEVAQLNYSVVTTQDHVKGLHYHLRQSDVWFCPPPFKLKAVMLDLRHGSPTAGAAQVVVLGEGYDAWLKIPPGVAHGYRPLTIPCGLFYMVTRCFDRSDPDEYRVPWDHPSVRDLWAIRNE
jgi:dTDP-4-dehydrorhamnose 3,5-epimerase